MRSAWHLWTSVHERTLLQRNLRDVLNSDSFNVDFSAWWHCYHTSVLTHARWMISLKGFFWIESHVHDGLHGHWRLFFCTYYCNRHVKVSLGKSRWLCCCTLHDLYKQITQSLQRWGISQNSSSLLVGCFDADADQVCFQRTISHVILRLPWVPCPNAWLCFWLSGVRFVQRWLYNRVYPTLYPAFSAIHQHEDFAEFKSVASTERFIA